MSGTNLHISLNNGNMMRVNLTESTVERIRMVSPASGGFSGKISIGTMAEWAEKPTYIPVKGEIVIYSDRYTIDGIVYPSIKIGDGNAYAVDLPFMTDAETNRIVGLLNDHVENMLIHVSAQDRAFWNNKLNYEIDEENLTFTRN